MDNEVIVDPERVIVPLDIEKIEEIIQYDDNVRLSVIRNFVDAKTRDFSKALFNYIIAREKQLNG